MDNQKNSPKDIVREIFERPKQATDKVSALFTHFKQSAQPEVISEPSSQSLAKSFPAAIDIGTSSIKLLQLAENSKGQIEVIALDRQEYTTQAYQDLITCQKQALKKIVERNKVGPNVVTGLGSKEIQAFNLTFPLMAGQELKEAIHWKLTQLKPFNLAVEEIEYDFINWGDSANIPKTAQLKLLVICAPKSVVLQRLDLLASAGLNAVELGVTSVSLVNLYKFKAFPSAKGQAAIWFDLGAGESSLAVGKNGFIYFLRNYSLTSQNITQQISNNCQMSEKDAESAKCRFGLDFWHPDKETELFLKQEKVPLKNEDKPAAVFYGIVSLLENLVVDIENSFKYFSYQVSQSQVTQFDKIILSGGGATLKIWNIS
ncbi:MAG: pilus assembly protein PilM [Candidatus Omnitrophota bacterium]